MIVPVIDLLAGRVVRGIGGRRHEYRPLEPVSDPLTVARGFREYFGLTTLYLADLDAIAGSAPAMAVFDSLIHDGFSLWVDAGVRQTPDAETLVRAGVSRVVAGLETVAGPAELGALARTCPGLVFSLDLKAGVPLAAWGEPIEIVRIAAAAGVTAVLVLDLSRVGEGGGVGTDALLREIRREWPALELIAGGGVRGPEDVRRLTALGVDHLLVASALHDGGLTSADVAMFSGH